MGWPDAAYGDLSTEGKCRLGFVIGLMSSTLKGPFRILQRTYKFSRKMAKSSLGGEVFALSEMAGPMFLLKGFFGPSGVHEPRCGWFGRQCESLYPPQYKEDDRREIPGAPFCKYPAGAGGR